MRKEKAFIREARPIRDNPNYILRSGTWFDWPKFNITASDLIKDHTKVTNFVGTKFKVSDIRGIKEYFRRISGVENGAPFEVMQYYEFQFFEDVVNRLFYDFRKRPGVEVIDQQLEENTDHGYSHQRRLEKLLKEFLKNDRVYRSNPNLLFNTLPQLLTIRFHDVLELLPTGKNHHTEGGALLALGFLLQNKNLFDHIVKENGGEETNSLIYKRIVNSTFIHCLYHTQPKLLEEIKDKIKSQKKVNIKDLIHKSFFEKFEKSIKYFKEHLGENSDLFKLINKGFNFLNSSKNSYDLSVLEINDMIMSSKVFAGLDKLDSVLPPELSTAKTFITMKGKPRPFFAKIEEIVKGEDGKIRQEIKDSADHQDIYEHLMNGETLTIDEEYRARLLLANSTFSPDDFSRLLFEMQRVDSMDLPPWLLSGFQYALEAKAIFLIQALPELFGSIPNFSVFERVYSYAEADQLTEFLLKYNTPSQMIGELRNAYLKIPTKEEKDEFIMREIASIGPYINVTGLFDGIYLLRREQEELEGILKKKIEQIQDMGNIGSDIVEKTRKLLLIADEKRPEIDVDPFLFTDPYVAYYQISPRKH